MPFPGFNQPPQPAAEAAPREQHASDDLGDYDCDDAVSLSPMPSPVVPRRRVPVAHGVLDAQGLSAVAPADVAVDVKQPRHSSASSLAATLMLDASKARYSNASSLALALFGAPEPRDTSDMTHDERVAEKRAAADALWAAIANTVLLQFAADAGGAAAVELWAPLPDKRICNVPDESMHLVGRHVLMHSCRKAEQTAAIGQTAETWPQPTAPGVGYAAVLAEEDWRGAGALEWKTLHELANDPEREEDTRAKALEGVYDRAAAIRLRNGNGAVRRERRASASAMMMRRGQRDRRMKRPSPHAPTAARDSAAVVMRTSRVARTANNAPPRPTLERAARRARGRTALVATPFM